MHKLPCFYTLSSFKEHEKLKEKVLKEINNSKVSSLVKDNDYYTDNINRVDWNQCTNFKRPWVQYLLQPLMAHIETEFNDRLKFRNKFLDVCIFLLHLSYFFLYTLTYF